jgi:phosphoglycerate dehydrogenase-like enzyme
MGDSDGVQATALRPAAFAMDSGLQYDLFEARALRRLRAVTSIEPGFSIQNFDEVADEALATLEILITGWGAPAIGRDELARLPRLRAIFHAAGTVKGHLSPEVWDSGILVTTAAAANAYPVAEYTLAMILLAGKGVLPIARDYRLDAALDVPGTYPTIGNYRRTVGIIGASTVGRLVIELLAPFAFDILLYDPVIEETDPILARARRVELAKLFSESSIVSIHAPLLPTTTGMVGAAEIALLPIGATVINTARAPIVDQAALTTAVAEGRLRAILDVTDPEPLPLSDPLRSLPDALLTPHIAGALGNELHRLGESALLEAELFAAGRPPAFPVHKSDLAASA